MNTFTKSHIFFEHTQTQNHAEAVLCSHKCRFILSKKLGGILNLWNMLITLKVLTHQQ